MATEAFFSKLPRGVLSPEEDELRALLHDTAAAAGRLLPRSGAVSLQQWMDRRMPGELFLGATPSGSVTLRPAKVEPVRSNPRPSVPAASNEDFFVSLPADGFTADELRLHDLLIDMVAHPTLISRVLQDGEVKLAKRFLPHGVTMEEWVERRIGQELVVFNNDKGQAMLKLAAPSKEDKIAQVAAFFDDLPDDSFTEMEATLRDALLDAVEALGGSTTLSSIGGDPNVSSARKACLINGVSLKEWITRRIASELILEEAGNGQWKVSMVAAEQVDPPQQGGKKQSGKGKEQSGKGKGKNDGKNDMAGLSEDDEQRRLEDEERLRAEKEDKAEKKEAFFAELPDDTLAHGEVELREALLDFLDGWTRDTVPSLSNAGSDEKVSQARAALLPKGVTLRDWIDRRIGGEIETLAAEGGSSEMFLGKRGEIDPDAVQRSAERLKEGKRSRKRAGKDGSDKGKGDQKGSGGGGTKGKAGGKAGGGMMSNMMSRTREGKSKGKGKADKDRPANGKGKRQAGVDGVGKGSFNIYARGGREPDAKRRRM